MLIATQIGGFVGAGLAGAACIPQISHLIRAARHFRHLPVAGEAGLLGVVDIIDVCRALIDAREG